MSNIETYTFPAKCILKMKNIDLYIVIDLKRTWGDKKGRSCRIVNGSFRKQKPTMVNVYHIKEVLGISDFYDDEFVWDSLWIL